MPFTVDLKGKNVLVTGGGRGLGIDIAKSLATAGANLVLTYNSSPADKLAAELEKEFGVKVKAYKMPGDDSQAISSTVEQVTKEFGELDVIVANAGICIHEDAETMSDKQFEDVFRVNTFGPYYLARAAYRSWFPNGRSGAQPKDKVILFVSSISGSISNTPQNQCSYNASKAALTHLGKSLAGEWVDQGVRVNTLSPGYICKWNWTQLSPKRFSFSYADGSESGKKNAEKWKELTPMHRFAQPKEIADWVTWMASPFASYQTGGEIIVDGGYTIF
ncbi:hypothetical protein OIV83_000385 [Microbotryomycetes sp. JL201]|nr:hypothetical protein OIV83_000385 [Microbotryomycetes sp. JL201]